MHFRPGEPEGYLYVRCAVFISMQYSILRCEDLPRRLNSFLRQDNSQVMIFALAKRRASGRDDASSR